MRPRPDRPAGRSWRWGEVQGAVPVPEAVRHRCAGEAAAFHREMEAGGFCADAVETRLLYPWLPPLQAWFPAAAAEALGFAPQADSPGNQLVLTLGVDAHVDDIHGPVLAWVLHNAGLRFRQGRVSHCAQAGEWFLFDDRRPHAVGSAPGATVFMAWVMPLREVPRPFSASERFAKESRR